MGKKKKKEMGNNFQYDDLEFNSNDLGFDDTTEFNDTQSFGNISPFYDENITDIKPILEPYGNTFSNVSQRINILRNRVNFSKGYTEKEIKKAKKKIKNGEYTYYETVVLKEGKMLKRKEEKLLKKINIIRVLKNLPIVKVIEHEEECEYLNNLLKNYKTYTCKRIDSRLIELSNEDFLRYISDHEVKELFINKEEPVFLDYDYIKEKIGIESIDNSLDIYCTLVKKLEKHTTRLYSIFCNVNNINVLTRINTHSSSFINYEDDIYDLHRDDILDYCGE